MLSDVLIGLRSESGSVDTEGQPTDSAEVKIVYAKKKSVKRSEFYLADVGGGDLRPELIFEIHSFEYGDGNGNEEEEIVVYNNADYRIIRTYQVGEKTELVCEKL